MENLTLEKIKLKQDILTLENEIKNLKNLLMMNNEKITEQRLELNELYKIVDDNTK